VLEPASQPAVSVASVHAELERARRDFHALVDGAGPADLSRRTDGTRWTNEQLLFHMLLGYGVVRTLLPLVHVMARLPDPVSRAFAAVLDALSWPFHLVNYVGPCVAVRVLPSRWPGARVDAVVASLHRALAAETEASSRASMHFPTGWDPYFRSTMTVLEVYHYATQHYDHHRRQLTLESRI
jgi:hypothetical protein